MKFVPMRSGAVQVALLAALLVLLPLLAWQQYDLLGRLSERERERMQANADSGVNRVSEEFDRALAELNAIFRHDMQGAEDPRERTARLYSEWRKSSAHAPLVRDLYYLPVGPVDNTLLRYKQEESRFVAAPLPPELKNLRLRSDSHSIGFDSSSLGDALAVSTPILSRTGNGGNEFELIPVATAILLLERDRLFDTLLEPLLRESFGGADGLEFQALVVARDQPAQILYRSEAALDAGDFEHPDAQVDLFTGRMRDFIFVTSEQRITPEAGSTTTETTTTTTARARIAEKEPGDGPARILISRFWNEKVAENAIVLTHESARWRLLVRHRAGSLEAVVSEARNRNLFVSFIALALLGATGAALFISARRAGRLARQQLEFVAGASHELRTPLSVIRAAAENLTDAVVSDGEQVRRYGALISREGRRMSSLVENLLLFARLRNGADFLDPAPVDLPALLATLIAERVPTPEEVRLDVDGAVSPVLGDEASLGTIFANLIDNARKYSDPPAQVTVRVGSEQNGAGGMVAVEVADRGWGMTAAELAQVFTPFYRGASARERNVPGNGIGLSLVKRLAELHGGQVEAASKPGEGSRFRVLLPSAAPAGAGEGGDGA